MHQGDLHALFQQNQYPSIATRERLARDLDIPESRIQVWFQTQCTRQLRQSRLGSAKSQGQGPTHGRRKWTSISPSQTSILQAFEKNRFPSIATREHLASLTGLPESRIQVWFRNRRAGHPGQSRSGPVKDMEAHPKPSPHVTVPVEPGLLASVPVSSPQLPLSSTLGSMQGLPAGKTPIPCMGFAPPVFCGGPGSQALGAMMVQPTQGGQGGDNFPAAKGLRSCSLTGPTLGGCLFIRQGVLCPPSQGEYQQQH
ncbi:double homeobox protein 4C-like [Eumetopias jubatus]|uniref:double homeobox protein 4C-like n=1 Tax=Eumetopias jubatus TaxID=34886 RepID=UPI001015D22C|nr:double homeobox protein 4C-like [Eumetopias jubatus]